MRNVAIGQYLEHRLASQLGDPRHAIAPELRIGAAIAADRTEVPGQQDHCGILLEIDAGITAIGNRRLDRMQRGTDGDQCAGIERLSARMKC